MPFEKYVIAAYLVHGLDHLENGRSKTEMKSSWPTKLEGHEAGSDAALVLPISPRAIPSGYFHAPQARRKIQELKNENSINIKLVIDAKTDQKSL